MYLVYGAIGDALGFPVESKAVEKVTDFVDWLHPETGEEFKKGEYSDDTQLVLAVTRSIWEGKFHPEYFAYVELPLWVYYKRGAGKATVKAAMNLFSPRIQWYSNFYPGYEDAGGSGAAMRISPIVAAFDDKTDIVKYVIYSSIITHGSSKAILGAVLTASIMHSAKKGLIDKESITENFKDFYNTAKEIFETDSILIEWRKIRQGDFINELEDSYRCTAEKIGEISKEDDYSIICEKAGEYDSPGMGISVSLCAMGLALKLTSFSAKELLLLAANENGTDSDTVASILGSIAGFYGQDSKLSEMAKNVQDYQYLLKMQNYTYNKESRKREIDRQKVRNYAMELEKALKSSTLSESPHPVFGNLRVLEERGKIFKVGSEEGQTLFIKHQ